MVGMSGLSGLVATVTTVSDMGGILQGYVDGFVNNLPKYFAGILVVILFMIVGKWVQKLIVAALERVKRGGSGAVVVSRLAYIGVLTLGLLIALTIAVDSFDFGVLVGTLGLSSVAIGFAFKEILENFIAGIYILISKPFEVGDVIEIGGTTGTVTEIGTRAAVILQFDRKVTVMPCSRLFKEDVTVISREKIRRLDMGIGIAYGSDLELAKRVVEEAVMAVEGVTEDPAALAVFSEFADSSINGTVYFFSDLSENDPRVVKNAALKAVDDVLAANNIEIPYPHQVHIEPEKTVSA